jgi:hypothetical protein
MLPTTKKVTQTFSLSAAVLKLAVDPCTTSCRPNASFNELCHNNIDRKHSGTYLASNFGQAFDIKFHATRFAAGFNGRKRYAYKICDESITPFIVPLMNL